MNYKLLLEYRNTDFSYFPTSVLISQKRKLTLFHMVASGYQVIVDNLLAFGGRIMSMIKFTFHLSVSQYLDDGIVHFPEIKTY